MPLTQVSSRAIEDTLRYVLGASGTNHYTFTGKGLTGAVNDPTLTLSRGHTYIFENRSGGHPFYIKTSIANGGTNDAYNTGVTNNGGGNGTEIVFTVPHDAPDTLYYQCSSHSSMNGQLSISGSVADGSITESKLADDAVTADKLANSINTAIAANTAKDLTALSASNLTSGTVPDARFPATLPAASAANLTSIPAANITGTLPAISGANLTNLPAGGVARNLIINGAMLVAQRGTSSTTEGYTTVDRFSTEQGGVDEGPTREQADVAAGTTPYTLGFRKCLKITNGNQTSGAGTSDRVGIGYKIEAQDIATSGWNYLSSSSYITISYWVKSSVAQNFYNTFGTDDGTSQRYVTETGSLSADTWTKITKTISGNSNLTFNNDNGEGLEITWELFRGTSQTGTRPLNAWAAADNNTRTPDQTSTWWTTNDATFELTGVQLQLGDSATDFAHQSYTDEFIRCQRYLFKGGIQLLGSSQSDGGTYLTIQTSVNLRANPTLVSFSASLRGSVMANASGASFYSADAPRVTISVSNTGTANSMVGGVNGQGTIHLDAEL